MKILRLCVTLLDIEPALWRRLEISDQTTLKQLHGVLQVAMGWTNSHLHMFEVGNTRYGVPDREMDDPWDEILPEGKHKVSEVLSKKGSKLIYWYDFGDDWFHEVTLEEVVDADASLTYPRVVDGGRACPPEDCGGPIGYENLLALLTDPKRKGYKELREWMGDDFDAEAFSVKAANGRLCKNRSLAAKQQESPGKEVG